MELKDTVEMMLSDDYKERFKAEYYQVKIRTQKLQGMLETWNVLNFEPVCDYKIIWEQYTTMNQYLEKLLKRAFVEGIDL